MEKKNQENEELFQTSLFGEPAVSSVARGSGSSRASARESSSSWGMVQQRKEPQPVRKVDTAALNEKIAEKTNVGGTEEQWTDWLDRLMHCEKCGLCKTRTKVVKNPWQASAKVVMLGEAPGGQEDLQGQPFVGQAGGILTEFLELAGLNREDLYIANTLKCRPVRPSNRGIYGNYANRKPAPEETAACKPILIEELKLTGAKYMVTLGAVALSWVLQKPASITAMAGKPFYSQWLGMWVFPIYHPAALIYDASKKATYLQHMAKLKVWLAENLE